MKSLIGCAALLSTICVPVAQAADCATLQQYWGEYSAAQEADNSFNYPGKLQEADDQFQRCKEAAWRYSGSMGSDYMAQAIRDCEDQWSLDRDNVESDYWLIRSETLATEATYYAYLNLALSEGLQCF